ncbi:DNA polymerase epsilon subunit 3 [Balamuthia mandrillaris]
MGDELELPKAVINRLIKKSLPEGVLIQKDAKLAIAKACKIWILYVTACANDFCQTSDRSLISANDVLAAMEELEFPQFQEPLKELLGTKGNPVKKK